VGSILEMASAHVELNTITYNAAVSACEKRCLWEQAGKLLVKMSSTQVELYTITHYAAVSACEKGGLRVVKARLA